MSLSTFLAFLVGILLSGVHGGEIPIINGILGGVYEGTPFRKISERLAAANVAGQLRVTENSGICETTAGVYQASGYGDLTATQSIWYVGPLNTKLMTEHALGSGSSKHVSTQLRRHWYYGSMEGKRHVIVFCEEKC